MTAKIFSFATKTVAPTVEEPIPIDVQFNELATRVLDGWVVAAKKNKLQEFILSKLPAYLHPTDTKIDIIHDLNFISSLELHLQLPIFLIWPSNSPDQLGWVAGFTIEGYNFAASKTGMPSESSARILNIVLFLLFTNSILKNKEK